MYIKSPYCELCGTTIIRLVVDHNHTTGFIRGTLCEVCNAHLGTFECCKMNVSKKYRKWFSEYIDKNSNLSTTGNKYIV